MHTANFDEVAKHYDRDFSLTHIGRLQRQRVQRLVLRTINHSPLRILEINCGTGEDAIWFHAQGHSICATDISAEMIKVAKQKAPEIDFRQCGFNELSTAFQGQQFDLIFSNFGGLNCLDRDDLSHLQSELNALLRDNGRLIVVMIAKKSWMEGVYFTWKGMPEKAHRRRRMDNVNLGQGISQPTWCYSVSELREIFQLFRIHEHYPIGIVIPPTYLEQPFQKFAVIPRIAAFLEELFGRFSSLSDRGDHVYLAFQKIV